MTDLLDELYELDEALERVDELEELCDGTDEAYAAYWDSMAEAASVIARVSNYRVSRSTAWYMIQYDRENITVLVERVR
jgi:hypothetical protein